MLAEESRLRYVSPEILNELVSGDAPVVLAIPSPSAHMSTFQI